MDTRYCYRMFQMVLLIALVLTLKHKENTPNEIMKIKLNFMGKNTVRMLIIRIIIMHVSALYLVTNSPI